MSDSKPTLLAHLPKEVNADTLLESFLTYTEAIGLALYEAQEEAILELFSGKNVILNTPTGSGKSLVALALCFKILAEQGVAFYTAPIKALVNEKFFDLCRVLGPDNVGLMTGDGSVNADAPIVCATAEIVSNLALRNGAQADIDAVVMDEFHYYGDRDRGVAWQIPLLTLPQTRFLLMSATLGKTETFIELVEKGTGEECVLVKRDERPVPLDFAYASTPMHATIAGLLEKDLAPIYIVHFTQREAAETAQNLMSIDFLSKDQKKAIREMLKSTRFDSPFGKELQRWLPHGVGVHHAGMLPKYRLLVERLAQKGMLKIICGTDTLGVGVNVPIRTVLFSKLCKYDGEKTAVLKVRDFKQIAGRAGRRGFDDRGMVIAQAPAHVIENEQLRAKAGGDAKKLRRVKTKKPPERGYAHWDEQTFEKLHAGEPETLRSRFHVTQGMILNLLSRQDEDDASPKAGCRAIDDLIRRVPEPRKRRFQHGRKALSMLRSLVDAGVVEIHPQRGPRLQGELQLDFALNQAVGLYVVEALAALDSESPEYALDVLTLVEATLEDPHAVLRKQLDTLKGRAIARMKAQGMEYDERMEELEKIDNPKPLADFLYQSFEAFTEHHPWAKSEKLYPKSIARHLYEEGLSFGEYVKDYSLQRSEGVLLRHLSNAYKALVQSVPEDAKTEPVQDLADWLGGVVRGVDASLLDEWEHLKDPDAVKASLAREELDEGPEDITKNERAFTVLVRNAVWRVVQALARRDAERAAHLLAIDLRPDEENPLAAPLAGYFAEHELMFTDPGARSPRLLTIERRAERWSIQQILSDPADHHDWQLALEVDLGASREAHAAVFSFVGFGQVG